MFLVVSQWGYVSNKQHYVTTILCRVWKSNDYYVRKYAKTNGCREIQMMLLFLG